MTNLAAVIKRVRSHQVDKSDWLYIAGDAVDLCLETEADLGCPEFDDDTDEEVDPDGFAERELWSTIDVDTLEHCIEWADRLSGSQDDHAAADIIRYYIRFDAWPNTLNASDPPPAEEILLNLDREFCDKLGPEDLSRRCRRDGCSRGVVKLSVFCRRHHFESTKKRSYPFAD